MRIINSIFSYLKKNKLSNNEEHSDLLDIMLKAPKVIPFVIDSGDYNDAKNVVTYSQNMHPPFKIFSIDINDVFGNLPGKSKWLLYSGMLLVENDDLSISEVVPFYKAEALDLAFNMNAILPINDISIFRHSNINELIKVSAPARAMLSVLYRRDAYQAKSKNPVHVKRTGVSPDFVKKLTIVSTKKSVDRLSKTLGEKVDWKHQWRVMGHWRNLNPKSLGRDRDGSYSIPGRTWVTDFIKGNGPLIEKPRLVKTFKGDLNEHKKSVT